MNLNDYRALLTCQGQTLRERTINRFLRDLDLMAADNPSYKPIAIDGVAAHAIVNTTKFGNIKEFVTLAHSPIPLGSIIQHAEVDWIVYDGDADAETYAKCYAKQCNIVLRWRTHDGVIQQRSGFGEDATKYSEGVAGSSMLRVGEFQIKVIIPLDKDTIALKRDHRFFVDALSYIPTLLEAGVSPGVFRVSRRNVVTWTSNDIGCVELTLIEDQYIDGVDDPETAIAMPGWTINRTPPPPSEGGGGTEGGWL